jgi:phage virion morphogenesis protein
MNIDDFVKQFPQKIKEIVDYTKSDKLKRRIGVLAENHFKESFHNEGFTDQNLEPWKDVKRRDPKSGWYGFSGQSLKFSEAQTSSKILSGETKELHQSIAYETLPNGVRIKSDKPYAAVHQFGLTAKVFGKHAFTMPARPFIGRSKVLIENIERAIVEDLKEIVKK